MMEISEAEHNEEKKKIARNEDSLRDLWENIKCNSILITGVPEIPRSCPNRILGKSEGELLIDPERMKWLAKAGMIHCCGCV